MKTKHLANYLFLIPIIVFVVIKIPHLFLPYFWDEAWSYFPTIKKMAEMGPGLLPGAIPLGYSKGHPQLFLFLISSWMNLHLESIPFLRLFPFMISASLLLTIYWVLKKYISRNAALIAVTLTTVQSVFLAQSTLIFPEVLSTILLFGAVFSFYMKNYGWYAVVASMMVLTKETAIIFAFTLGIFYLASLLKSNNRKTFQWPQLFLMLVPGLTYAGFLLLHFLKFGTFFYTDHMGYIDLVREAVTSKLTMEFNVIFVNYGRILISIAFVLLIVTALILKIKIKHARLLWLILACIAPYIFFSAINFYTFRYMLPPLVIFVIGFAVSLSDVVKSSYISTGLVLVISFTCLYYSITDRRIDDHTLGYVEVLGVQKDLVRYCESNNLFNEPIAANFLVGVAMKNQELGFKGSEQEFTEIKPWTHYLQCKYFIYDCTPDVPKEVIDEIKSNFKLIKSFENKHALGYIYENENFLSETK